MFERKASSFSFFRVTIRLTHPIRELDEWSIKKGALNEVLGYEEERKNKGFNSHRAQSNLFNKMVLVQIIERLN